MKRLKLLIVILGIGAASALPACREQRISEAEKDAVSNAYDVERDSSDPQHLIPLNYEQSQGKRVFYATCVWCHADSTPAGPSNRANLNPAPPLINDGATFNELGDEEIKNTITLGGSAMGKSAAMPPWGQTLSQDDLRAVISYIRAVAQPPYERPARPAAEYSVK